MKNYKINNIDDVLIVLKHCRRINDHVVTLGLDDDEREDVDFDIQMMIGNIDEYFYGQRVINNENLVTADIFSFAMWNFITRESNKEELYEFLKEENLI